MEREKRRENRTNTGGGREGEWEREKKKGKRKKSSQVSGSARWVVVKKKSGVAECEEEAENRVGLLLYLCVMMMRVAGHLRLRKGPQTA